MSLDLSSYKPSADTLADAAAVDGAYTAIETYVNGLPTGLNLTVNTQTTSYTLVLGDANKLVEINNAAANNLTVPPNTSVAFPVGTCISIGQYGAGKTTIVAGAGVTLRAYNGNLNLAGQYAMCSLIKRATDEWWVAGNLVP